MNKKLQELYEAKIKIYETMINEIKTIDFALIAEFEKEFNRLEDIDKKIKTDPELMTQQIMKFKL